jgi:polysaccharide chain length determinant protein (PEP-CTERM system associated)
MALRTNMEPKEILEIFSRRKWLIIFSILIVMFGASIYCVVVPNQYKSSTMILVIPPRVSKDFVQSAVGYSVQDRLSSIRQQVLSRTRLMQVIEELGLFKDERKSTPPEALVTKMQKRIDIDVIGGKDAFTLSFVHESPKIAMVTTAKLASFFIGENMRVRELAAVGTTQFLESQLKSTKVKLEEQEEKVKRYKLQYMGELPQQMEVNLNLLSRLQDQEKSYTEAIARAEDRKLFMETEISKLQSEMLSPKDPMDTLLDTLAEKEKLLQDLTAGYTESYPTIIQLRREIKQLEEEILTLQNTDRPGSVGKTGTVSATRVPIRTSRREKEGIRRLRDQVASLKLDITALRREKAENRETINSIDAKVGRLPEREQELVSLTRDYENLKRSYDDLLKKKLQAGISQNLEELQKGERFQVLDPPNLPVVPFKPDRLLVLGYAFIMAVALGFGGATGLEFLDPTLRDVKEFKYFYDLPVLASIPIIRDGQYTRNRKMRRKALIAAVFSLASAIVVFMLVYQEKIRVILKYSGGS